MRRANRDQSEVHAVPFFLSLGLESPIRETPAPSAPLLACQLDQFQIQIQNMHLYLLVDQIVIVLIPGSTTRRAPFPSLSKHAAQRLRIIAPSETQQLFRT